MLPPWNLSNIGAQTSHFLSFPQDMISKQIRRISLNNSRGRLFEGGDYFSCCSLEVVPYISCFIIPLNQTIITSNKLNTGLLSVPNSVPGLIFRVKSSKISFAGSDSTSTWQGGDKRKRRWWEGWGGGDYSREATILNISIKGGRLFEGRLLFKEIR